MLRPNPHDLSLLINLTSFSLPSFSIPPKALPAGTYSSSRRIWSELQIRKVVIREVPNLVKSDELVDKIADVLSQMLQQTDEPKEIVMLTSVLIQFLKTHPKDVLSAVFLNIIKSDEEAVRLRLLKFIKEQMQHIPVMRDVTATEFDLLFDLMFSLSYFQTLNGRVMLYQIIVDQLRIDEPFPANDPQRLDQILYLVERTRSLMSVNCRSTVLVEFMISKGIPVIEKVNPALRVRFLRALVSLAPFTKTLERKTITILFEYLMRGSSTSDDMSAVLEQELHLDELESTTFAFVSFCKSDRTAFEYLMEHHNNNWQARIIYLARLLQRYIVKTSADLQDIIKSSSAVQNKTECLVTVASGATRVISTGAEEQFITSARFYFCADLLQCKLLGRVSGNGLRASE
ncbi:unnamed protein product [Gongylonema pulchrum]|uniref:26S proteasome non-ATPase regulatory subunit 5 n=1 Tax=Gongylonema pulchrum TaxID=637853 RepID=A0A183DS71_9BILA|nr:unnamed protein product [Gongylonema pulchrum]